ncbi:NACHT domain-containing protein [Actinoplanes philippinensis]|uniref:NACHT domain-containing protein n=1 Tax=Actinoplanes philippinensis TaxID=35752 RepID=UPI0033C691B2
MAPSPYSLDGARAILSGPDDGWARKLGALLGVGVLAAGPAGVIAGSSGLLTVWGWVDQKNELVGLLTALVGLGRDRLRGGRTVDRDDVLVATHTALVYGAFFAGIRDGVGPVYDRIGVTDDDKRLLTDRAAATLAHDHLTRPFSTARVPLPWAGSGFHDNRDTAIVGLYRELAGLSIRFFQHFACWERAEVDSPAQPLIEDVVERALRRYDAEYRSLAADVGEFEIWAMLGEHRATQLAAGRAVDSLARLEELVVSFAGAARQQADRVRRANANFNRAVLADPIVTAGVSDDLPDLEIPTIEAAYLSPSFRWTVMGSDSRPADEDWWNRAGAEGTDLDAFLAAYFASPQSHERPLVVLGHPGSGKSMFTKVCAARLSGSDAFAVARIPLRKVPDATAPVYRQFADTLGRATQGHVEWDELNEASDGATRVLLIDGLDEFMQASGTSESNYLASVVDFQRTERKVGHPVAVVVTSRTLVADLARIPGGCLVVKLEDFRPEQVQTWLDIWTRANPRLEHGIPAVESVLSYGGMARQPLLLLLLVLYGVSSGLPAMAEESTPAQIYGDILRRFIKRELGKPTDTETDAGEETLIRAELWRLGIAAFAMFNRGRHYIEEELLLEDLHALDPAPAPQRPAPRRGIALNSARRVLGRFFFIHSAEAGEGHEGRSYEFLHATFSEYLIAHFIRSELAELWESRDRPSSQNWDDDRLYALLSHHTLDSGASAVLPFVRQLHAHPDSAAGARRILRILIRESGNRWGPGRFGAYAPSPGGYVERFATYTANLMLLLLAVEEMPVTIESISPPGAPPSWWPRLVRIWEAYLSPELLGRMAPDRIPERAVSDGGKGEAQHTVHAHWLASDRLEAMIANAGHGLMGFDVDSPDLEINVMGLVGRAFTEPDTSLESTWAVQEILDPTSGRSIDHNALPALAAYVAQNPEAFTPDEVERLMGFHEREIVRFAMRWSKAILVAQYPTMSGNMRAKMIIRQTATYDPPFVALLAGVVVWGDEWASSAEILERTPEPRRSSALALRPMVAGMAGFVDPRRQVLIVAHELARRDRESDGGHSDIEAEADEDYW